MLMILARLVRSESFWAVVKVRSPHTGPEVSYPRRCRLSPTTWSETISSYATAGHRRGVMAAMFP